MFGIVKKMARPLAVPHLSYLLTKERESLVFPQILWRTYLDKRIVIA